MRINEKKQQVVKTNFALEAEMLFQWQSNSFSNSETILGESRDNLALEIDEKETDL